MQPLTLPKNALYEEIGDRIAAKQPLTGKALDLAVSLAEPDELAPDDDRTRFDRNIVAKLKAGEPLDDYEASILVDVYMLHAQLQ